MKVLSWIQSIGSKKIKANPNEVFYGMFIRLFGERHFSFKCILRSVTYSTIMFILIIILLKRIEPWFLINWQKWISYTGLFLYLLLCVQDYFSLFKTRLILGFLGRSKFKNVFIIVLIDILTTICIMTIFLNLFYLITDRLAGRHFPLNFECVIFALNPWEMVHNSWIYNIQYFFDTVFLGTFIIIIIQLSGIFTNIYYRLSEYFRPISRLLNLQEKPIKSLGAILIFVITTCYLITTPILLIFS